MTRRTAQPFLAGALLASTSLLSAATPGIGVVLSSGSVTVDNSVVASNATVFDGNTVQTGATSSRLQLNNGKLVQLGAESTARVYSDHMILEKGFGQASGSYGVEANTLKISGDNAKVAIFGKTVEVAALGAPVVISNATGIQVANLMPGKALAFTPQDSGAAMAPTSMVGVVRNSGGTYMLTDTTSNATVQLMGGGVEKYVKHMVKVTGTPGSGTAAAGASQIINVTNIEDQGKAKRGMGGPAAAAGSGGGGGNGAVIVAGIAVAAGLAATAAVLATQSNNSSPVFLSPND